MCHGSGIARRPSPGPRANCDTASRGGGAPERPAASALAFGHTGRVIHGVDAGPVATV